MRDWGGVRGWGVGVAGGSAWLGVCMARGHAWWGGACVVGGMCGRGGAWHAPQADTTAMAYDQ